MYKITVYDRNCPSGYSGRGRVNRVMLTAVEIELLLEEYEGAVFSRTGFPALDKASRELLQQIIDLTSCVKEKWCKKCFWITARRGDVQKYAEWAKKQGRDRAGCCHAADRDISGLYSGKASL